MDYLCKSALFNKMVEEVQFMSCCLVLKNYDKCKQYASCSVQKENLKKFSNCVLLNHIVKAESTINLLDSKLARTYGICYIIVSKITISGNSGLVSGIVTKGTDIHVEYVQSEDFYNLKMSLTPTHLGGFDHEIKQLSGLFALNNSSSGSIHQPLGVLFHGPPGCGKTSLGKFLAHKCGAVLVSVEGADVLQSEFGSGATALKTIFKRAVTLSQEGPLILFFDELDSLCPSHENASIGNKQLTNALASEMDDLQRSNTAGLLVIGATNFISSVNRILRRPGRFDQEMLISVPTTEQRISILQVLTSDIFLNPDVSVSELAKLTSGFVGADLHALCLEAGNHAQSRCSEEKVLEASCASVTMSDFMHALHNVTPSLRKSFGCVADLQHIGWEEIGGLEEVKIEIQQSIEWPLRHPDVLRRMDLSATRGLLLYGPPGCCKTTLVRAAATSCHVTFLSLNGAQVYSPYVGESERIISEAFQKARALAPSILFLDEIESLVGKRSSDSDRSRVQERILATLLNEMDGIGTRLDRKMDSTLLKEKLDAQQSVITRDSETTCPKVSSRNVQRSFSDMTRVIVIGATNRPEMLDAAIVRPGRLDKKIYVPPPDLESREAILKIQMKKMPTLEVDIKDLSEKTKYFSGADLKNLCKEAGLVALREGMERGDTFETPSIHVKHVHFEKALETVKPSLYSFH